MSTYLVTGLESSTTKLVAKLLAYNLDIIYDLNVKTWDGNWEISNEYNKVTHRSIPHGDQDLYIDGEYASQFDFVIIVTRDWYCSLRSKVATHQPNFGTAAMEHVKGRACLLDIFDTFEDQYNERLFLFSYETAFILRRRYLEAFFKNLGISKPKTTKILDINGKYHLSDLK